MRAKQALYERTSVPLVWWVNSETQTVTVLHPGKAPPVVDRPGVLDGGAVLLGFRPAHKTSLELWSAWRQAPLHL